MKYSELFSLVGLYVNQFLQEKNNSFQIPAQQDIIAWNDIFDSPVTSAHDAHQ
jgi:hypothetical protein